MQQNTRYYLPIRHWSSPAKGRGPAASTVNMFCRRLVLFGIALAFSMSLPAGTRASGQPDAGGYENLDIRWLPWIGSWRLVSNGISGESAVQEQYLMTIIPDEDGKSITMKGFREQELLSEEKIVADGVQRPLTGDECTGWYMYSWSKTGKRLLLKSESSCPGDLTQMISGMSIIDGSGDWVDIQLLKNGEERAVAIRRYRNADNTPVTPGRTEAVFARISAGVNFSIDEIIELSPRVEPEVLEVAILELRKPFPIDSQQLVRLSDSGVPSQVVDLMVALSFPDKFQVEKTTVSPVERPMARIGNTVEIDDCWDYGYPYFPWHWRSFYHSPCDYWDWGWGAGLGWYYTYRGRLYSGGTGQGIDFGRLVEGRGYTRVSPSNSGSAPGKAQPRYAQPRNAPAGQDAAGRQTSGSLSGMSSSGNSGVSSGSSSSRSSSGSSSKDPCASPGGYSSGSCY